jgi:hypothetical protein
MLRTQVVSLGFECDERHASDPKPSPMHDAGLFSWACLARRECELAGSCGSGLRVVQTRGGLDIVAMATLYPWRRGVNVEERVEGGGAHAAAQRPLHKDRVASPMALLGLVACVACGNAELAQMPSARGVPDDMASVQITGMCASTKRQQRTMRFARLWASRM